MNQYILAKEERLNWFQDRVKQYTQNRMFQNNVRKFFHQLGSECTSTTQKPDWKKGKLFWTWIWEKKEQRESQMYK